MLYCFSPTWTFYANKSILSLTSHIREASVSVMGDFERHERRANTRRPRNGEDMLEIITNDILRYELLAEQEINEEMEYFDGTEFDHINTEVENVDPNHASAGGADDTSELDHNGARPRAETERFVVMSNEDTDTFLKENVNKNTVYKTRSDLKIFKEWALANNEHREIQDIPAIELDALLARFYLGLRKKDGSEYELNAIGSIQNSIDRYLKDMKVNFSIKRDSTFSHSNRVLMAKRKSLKAQGKGNKSKRAEALTKEEIAILYSKKILGAGK